MNILTDQMRDELLIRLDERTERQEQHLVKLDHTIHGNGSPGVKADLQEVRQAQQDCPARLAYDERDVRGWMMFAVAAIMLSWNIYIGMMNKREHKETAKSVSAEEIVKLIKEHNNQ